MLRRVDGIPLIGQIEVSFLIDHITQEPITRAVERGSVFVLC